MGVDSIKKTHLLKKRDIEKKLKFKFLPKNLLITYHPETLSKQDTKKGIEDLLKSLKNPET